MAAIGGTTILLSIRLKQKLSPLRRHLSDLRHGDKNTPIGELQRIREHYEQLIAKSGNINSADFSAGEIENLQLLALGRIITVFEAENWIKQAPSLLISLGLLGTFTGLTSGLGEISGVLGKGTTPAATLSALTAIVAPMSTAFQTSLIGLALSLGILIWTQINGTRTYIARCESLLSSWLETTRNRQDENQDIKILKELCDALNKTLTSLPSNIATSIQNSMNKGFAARLEQLFNASAALGEEAQRAVRQMAAISNSLNESGQDFVRAAGLLQHNTFASTLQDAVEGLLDSRALLTASSQGLSESLLEIRDNLKASQADWKSVAKAAEVELLSCRAATEEVRRQGEVLTELSRQLEAIASASIATHHELKESREEARQEREAAIQMAASVRSRLDVETTTVEACQSLIHALDISLKNWNSNIKHLDELQQEYFTRTSIIGPKNTSKEVDERSSEIKLAIDNLQNQLQADIRIASASHRMLLKKIVDETRGNRPLSQELLLRLKRLKRHFNGLPTMQQTHHQRNGVEE